MILSWGNANDKYSWEKSLLFPLKWNWLMINLKHIVLCNFSSILVACGITAILSAVCNHDIQTIRLLLEYNSPINLPGRIVRRREELYFDPCELAIHMGFFDVVEMLYDYGYNLSKYSYLVDPMSTVDIPLALKENTLALGQLCSLATNPHSLFKVSALSIRKVLRKNLHHKVRLLPLPPSLQEDLLCLAAHWQKINKENNGQQKPYHE